MDAAVAGEEIVLARAGIPLVRLVPVQEPAGRELGFLPIAMPEERFDVLDGDDLAAWA